MIRILARFLVVTLLVLMVSGVGGSDDEWSIGDIGLSGPTPGDGWSLSRSAPARLADESDGRGIGGTGLQAGTDGRGIGGTGIVGTITAFGSIWVNELEVHYSRDQRVRIFNGTGTTSDLRVGQVVDMIADEKGDHLQAREIGVRHAVAGPVWSIDQGAEEMTLLGQRVILSKSDPLARSLRPGDWVAVSGLRDDRGRVIASRLDPVPRHVPAFVRGTVEGFHGHQLFVGGRGFDLPRGTDRAGIETGRDLVLYGDPIGNGLRVRHLRKEPRVLFDGRVRNLVVEGVVGKRGRRVGALSLPDSVSGVKAGERVLVRGRVGADRRLEPSSVRLERVVRRHKQTSAPSENRGKRAPAGHRPKPRNERDRPFESKPSTTDTRRRTRTEKAPQVPQRAWPPQHQVRPLRNPWWRAEPRR